MQKVSVDKNICIDCGLCLLACSRGLFQQEEKNVQVDTSMCNECGHCFAICPSQAIQIGSFSQGEIIESQDFSYDIDPVKFLALLKGRRSIRHFKDQIIPREKLDFILEAGRFSPTASNKQENRFVLLTEKIDLIRTMALKSIVQLGQEMEGRDPTSLYYKKAWQAMYDNYIEKGLDELFFKAPHVLLIIGNKDSNYREIDGSIAASRMEIMANSLGLGVCYIGFFKEALKNSPDLKEAIGLREEEDLILTMVIGYPNIEYKRSVDRKPLDVSYF